MRFFNCSLSEAEYELKGKRIVFFGAGSWLTVVENTALMSIKEDFVYIIDNRLEGSVKLGDIKLPVYRPDRVIDDKDVVIIITSAQYMYEMYIQLEKMNLSDEYICCSLPFMQKVSGIANNSNIKYKDLLPQKIPKMIHSFWFSGEEKPVEYQKYIETWGRVLCDYEIREWNMDNYDWERHPFVKRAIELKAWAYAADFARLDVISELGGIYLDMDVEVLKPFDDLMGNDAFLAFSNNVWIDLAVFGAGKGNRLIQELRHLYDEVELPKTREEFFGKYYQLAFVRKTLINNGIIMNGALQRTKYATVFPSSYFIVEDYLLREPYEIGDNTYSIHHANMGWNPEMKRQVEKRRILWDKLNNG